MKQTRKLRFLALIFPLAIILIAAIAYLTLSAEHPIGTPIAHSSGDLRIHLGGSSLGFGGPGKFRLQTALTNWNHIAVHAQLFAGKKLHRLVSTNASVIEFGIALAQFANAEVMIPGTAEDLIVTKIGAYDSDVFRNRHAAAAALATTLSNANWVITRTSDHQLALLPKNTYENLVTGSIVPPVLPPDPPPVLPPQERIPIGPGTGANLGFE